MIKDYERKAMLDPDYSVANHIYADEIGEIMSIVTKEDGAEKIGNTLYSAITKAFVLGYIRGTGKKKYAPDKSIQFASESHIMEMALARLRELLASAGLSPEEADILLFQFLEEEAYPYVELMDIYRKTPERFWKLIEPKNEA